MNNPSADPKAFKAHLDQMTEQLVAVERRAKMLAELNRLLSQGRDPLALAQRAVDLVMRATEAYGTYVYLWDPESQRLVMRVATTGRVAAHVDRIQLRLGEGITGWSALMRQTVVLHDDIQLDPRFVGFPGLEAEDAFRSMVAVPIAVPGGDLLGVFTLYSERPGAFDTHHVDLATEVGSLLASGLVHAETMRDLRRQSAAARFLMTVPADATSSRQRCADVLAESVRDQVDAVLCIIEIADRNTMGGHDRPGIAFADHVEKSIAVASRSVQSRADLPPLVDRLGVKLHKFTTSFGAHFPLGTITCYRGRPFTEADSSILEALGAQAAALVASLSNPAMTTPLAGRLAAAPAPESAERILRDLGWHPGPTYPVLVRIRSVTYGTPAAFDRLLDALREMCAGVDGVALLPSAPMVSLLIRSRPEQWKTFEQALRNTVKRLRSEVGGGVAVGIGPLASDARDLAVALDKAEWGLGWAELLGESTPVVHYQDVAHLQLLPKVAMDISEGLREALARISEVIRYDLRHGTALSATLETYLASHCSATDTANALFIHRNTLRQRLGRIEELIGRPVDQLGNWREVALAARLALAAESQLADGAIPAAVAGAKGK
ncbi:helix-turn-helix domain-containing protein [Streptomyces sp. NPDC052042]|uniref:helix-turn-helix domain-containing protein n=1 Tax=Streptomyces sp. NPDC052042 TaxID=3365683 RepID=UPI0037D74553